MITNINSETFSAEVTRWWRQLRDIINDIRSRGAHPRLVALSRKMPRFVKWFKTKFVVDHSPYCDDAQSILDEIELTTELALPFYFYESSNPGMQYEYILLDDFIIHGTTLRSVADTLHLLSGLKCHISCLFRLEKASGSEYIYEEEFNAIPPLPDDKLSQYIDLVCEIIQESELPIDMEFPVFEVNKNWESFPRLLDIFGSTPLKSLTCFELMPDNLGATTNIDFFKIRYFIKKEDYFLFEVYAPAIFATETLIDVTKPLFPKSMGLQRIWDNTTLHLRQFLSTPASEVKDYRRWDHARFNFTRSLCVWANYLVSLASYVNVTFSLHIDFPVTLNLQDLKLLITAKLTDSIADDLKRLFVDQLTYCAKLMPIYDTKKSFAPELFAADYLRNKVMASVESESLCQLLTCIFAYQHYSNPLFNNQYLQHERPVFGETFDSLVTDMIPYYMSDDDISNMHLWIDSHIDSGHVVPKYESVKNSSGAVYWRRFFHAGIRRFADADLRD